MLSSDWLFFDNVGNSYENGLTESSKVVAADGYQGGGTHELPPVLTGDMYQGVLNYLRSQYGVIVVRVARLGVDVMTLPGEADPISRLLRILTTDRMPDGSLLISHFRLLEVISSGIFGEPEIREAEPIGAPYAFPNDPLYRNSWNVSATYLDRAPWHPAPVRKRVRIAIIDSGIGKRERRHEGLDGASVQHRSVAPTSGFPSSHALNIVSLLADRAQDGGGITGLTATWEAGGCYPSPALFNRRKAEILSFNVGDHAPSTLFIADAIHQSIEAKVDVINLSLRVAYSPLIEQAVRRALDQNIIVVAAAGNYDEDAAARPTGFPANIPGVIAVGSADRRLRLSATSARDGLTLTAPGEDIVVGGPRGTWYATRGTSYAAPHVTATVAMMKALRPEVTPAEAGAALRRTAQRQQNGPGFLDAFAALNEVLPRELRADVPPAPFLCNGDGAGKLAGTDAETPASSTLIGNYPNPFNPQTTVRFYVAEPRHVELAVFNLLGQQVAVLAQGPFEAGYHALPFDGHDLPSGTYLYRLTVDGRTATRTMMLLK